MIYILSLQLLLLIHVVNSYRSITIHSSLVRKQYPLYSKDIEILPLLETAPWISSVDDVLPAPYNNLVDVNLNKQTIIYEVTLGRELCIEFAQANGYVYISHVSPNSRAEGLGIKVNDIIVAISATAGDKLWFHGTVEGLVSALSTRFVMSSSVTLQLERPLESIENDLKNKLKIPLLQTVRIKRPLGIHVHEGPCKGVFIQYIKPGHGAALSKRIEVGDEVVALSASWGDRLWDIDSVESFIVSVGMRSDSHISLKLKRMVPIDTFTGALTSSIKHKSSSEKTETANKISTYSALIEKIDAASNVDNLISIWMDIRNDTQNYLSYYTNFYINKLMTASLKYDAADAAAEIFEKTYCYHCNDSDIGICLVPNNFVCTTVLKAYGIRNETTKILSLLSFLDNDTKQHADGAFFSSLLVELTKAKQFNEVDRLLYDEIPSRNISYNSVLSNNLLYLYSTLETGEGALKLYQLMKQKEISISSAGYSAFFKALLTSDKTLRDKAFALLSALPSSSLSVNIFNQFLESYYVTKNYGKLKIILRMMNAANIDLDVKGYGFVINLLAETNKPRVALNVFNILRKKGLNASKHCYMGALKAMRSLRDAGGTVQMLVEMNEKKLYPELPHYTAAMFGCIAGNQYSLVETIFDAMVMNKISPDTAIYTFLLQALLEQGKLQQGFELFEKMKVGNDVPAANTYTYSYIIKFCILNNRYEYANEVLDFMMTSINTKIDSRVLFTSLLEVIPSPSKKYMQKKEIEFKSLRELNGLITPAKESLGFLIKLCEKVVNVPEYFYVELLTCLYTNGNAKYVNNLLQSRINGKIIVNVITMTKEIENKEKKALAFLQKSLKAV